MIVKYSGSLERIASDAMQVTELSNEYAILRVRESLVETLAALPEIEYMENRIVCIFREKMERAFPV